MFRDHNKTIRKLLSDNPENTDWENILNHHRQLLSRIKHERLIHLLVTLFVGLVLSIIFSLTVITKSLYLFFALMPIIGLFIGYLLHYRFLENTTQGWYKLEDEIELKLPR